MDNISKPHTVFSSWWQEKGQEILDNAELSDIDIVVEYKDEPLKRIHGHKCFLYLISPVWCSAVKWATDNEVKITEYPFSVINALIRCGYINKLEIESLEHCLGIMKAADYYDMKSPIEFCNEYIHQYIKSGTIELEDIVVLLNMSVMLKLNTIRLYCLAFIEDNPLKFFESDNFFDLSLEAVQMLTNIQNYICEEDYLIRIVLKWCEAYCDKKEVTLKEFVTKNGFLKSFRWQILRTEERRKLIADFPDIFEGELFCKLNYDSCLAANYFRGKPNESGPNCIIVNRPPILITEVFTYFGDPMVLPVASIRLSPRCSAIEHTITKAYEEKLIIEIMDRILWFDGIVSDSSGPVIPVPPPALLIPLANKSSFTVTIQFRKTGVYYKNTSYFEYGQGLYRSGGGIIECFNSSYDAPSQASPNPHQS